MINNVPLIWRLAFFQFRVRSRNSFFWMLMLIYPSVYLAIGYFGSSMAVALQRTHLIIAVGLTSMWSSVLFGSGWDIERERVSGTLEFIVAAPTSLYVQMLLKSVVNALCGLIPFGLVLLLSEWLLKWHFVVRGWFAFVACLGVITGMSASGILVCAFAAYSRTSRGYMKTVQNVIKIAGGFWIPLNALVLPFRIIGMFFPPSWMVLAIDSWMDGSVYMAWSYIAISLVTSAFMFFCGRYILDLVENHTRTGGSLALF